MDIQSLDEYIESSGVFRGSLLHIITMFRASMLRLRVLHHVHHIQSPLHIGQSMRRAPRPPIDPSSRTDHECRCHCPFMQTGVCTITHLCDVMAPRSALVGNFLHPQDSPPVPQSPETIPIKMFSQGARLSHHVLMRWRFAVRVGGEWGTACWC